MNFAGKKLNGFYKNTAAMSVREKRLLAENRKLKKKNKRLSSAMLYLVGHIETRLPLWNSNTPSKTEEEKPLPLTPQEPPRKKPVQAKKKKIIGKTWMPEKLEDQINAVPRPNRRRNPLSVPQIFAKKEPSRIETENEETEIADFPIQTADNELPSEVIEIPPEPAVLHAEEVVEQTALTLTPDFAPEEVDILAAPTKDKQMDIIHPHPSEIIGENEDKKTSAKEASMAYLAVSVAAQPVPKSNVVTILDDAAVKEDEILEKQVAQQNEMMRAAMLRRVNRLRW
ncbi:hypothetical protein A9Q83_18135 [Alphaproteobacteria bacterium 46_93_T64]|nr:hypothetical protein A9Q83_18135 [Alphaproteobacteria bacterium 46_93_T64]